MEIHSLEQLKSNTFPHVTRITISEHLRVFPKEIVQYADSLEILDLSNNQLEEVPEEIVRMKKLRILFLSNNRFHKFPVVLGRCPALSMIGFKSNYIHSVPEDAFPETLRWLILTDNRISELPASIGHCRPLEKVALAGNRLRTLPEEMASCRNLALLRISANDFNELPAWLLTMPRLAWLAYSGNPCSLKPKANSLKTIHWPQLKLLELLGQGASGMIYKAEATPGALDAHRLVAVKVFKGEVTSDGYPADEMELSSLLPQHPNLVEVLGRISGHPEQKEGLVFSLIPPGYRNLGLPPNFSSCSRDTFLPGTTFRLKQVIAILKAIGSVALGLHANGLLHGDLYAHNTLVNDANHAIFGDFGAATAYDIASEDAKRLERLEVRAFGNLMEDLLNEVHAEDRNAEAMRQLHQLKTICLLDEVLLRPGFRHITEKLDMLA